MNLFKPCFPYPKYWSKYKNKPIHFSNLPCNIQKHIQKLQKIHPIFDWKDIYNKFGVVGIYSIEECVKINAEYILNLVK